jgi:hypothetical protein
MRIKDLETAVAMAELDVLEASKGMKDAEAAGNWDACDYWYSMGHHVNVAHRNAVKALEDAKAGVSLVSLG